MATVTLICGECGSGNYGPGSNADYACKKCGHQMNARDFDLDAGEKLVMVAGALSYKEA